MVDLNSLFNTLRSVPLPNGSVMVAVPIPNLEQHHLARDVEGTPLILISVPKSGGRLQVNSAKFEHLTVQHDVQCRVCAINGSIQEGQYTVIACVDADHILQSYFLKIMATLVTTLGAKPTQVDVTQAVQRLAELFRALSAAPRKSVQGLWAELFVIVRAPDVATLVSAWHTVPEEKYDFSQASQRIEVKSAVCGTRLHQFSLEQLHPPVGTSVLIASVFVERAGNGTSLLDLLEQMRCQVSTNMDLIAKMDDVVALTLGNSWRHAINERFDYELAQQSLKFYEASDIPSVSPSLPQDVSAVRFASDLSRTNSISITSYRNLGGLFEAILRDAETK